ncbi:caspase-8 [Microplitis mediator]|uniref:caspase-8 n=1 Tax=Microplitis mediator TaxID=375433 RepID=UPI0025527422|nr:caspase-8 [Microplitis mediator]XP_057333415.1 caspase-8 [Microplitis mediator]
MSTLRTDALPCKSNLSNYTQVLDKNIINIIENDLNINQKISIIFLCIADKINANIYHNFMLKLISYNEKVIFNEDYKNNEGSVYILYDLIADVADWKDKFIEALCIINNKMIINQLGLIVDDLYQQYCPLQSRIVGKINVANKILFKLFESLGDKETKEFLKSIYSEKDVGFESDQRLRDIFLMEIHALYWLSIGFIKITPAGGDLSALLKYLKPLGHFDKPTFHDIEWYNKKFANKSQCFINNNNNNNGKLSLFTKLKSLNLKKKIEEIDSDKIIIKNGLCLIINEMNFPNTAYEDRAGSKADVENLKQTFKNLGFEISCYEDLRADEIVRKIHHYATRRTKHYDCFVVCLLSHGYPDGIISSDHKKITFEDIEKCLCLKEMSKTLKLVIVQACQGDTTGIASSKNNLAVDGCSSSDKNIKLPKNLFADGNQLKAKKIDYRKEFLLFKSTMKGYVAIRHKEQGSWFITDVCKVLNDIETHLSIDEWSRQVKKKISSRCGEVNGLNAGQLAETERDRRTKQYFFLYQPINQ